MFELPEYGPATSMKGLAYTPFDPTSLSTIGFSPIAAPGMVGGFQQMPNPVIPGAPGGLRGMLGRSGFGANMQTFQTALGGLQTLGQLWGSMKALDVAKKQLSFTRDVTNANLANQTQSYNTAIADRARARGVTEGQTQAQVDDYISRNSLTQRKI